MRLPVFLAMLLIAAPFFASPLSAQDVRRYIVELRDEPVIGHLAPQSSGDAFRTQMLSAAASNYRAQLRAQQATLRQRLETFPGAHVDAQLDTVLNALIVSLRPQDVAAVKQDPAVADVVPSVRYRKLLDAAVPLTNIDKAWATPAVGGESNAGAGVKIAIIDTGIDINHPMFQDSALIVPGGYPRSTSSQSCINSDQNFTNSKVIVARNYVKLLGNPDQNCDAEDRDGHGTFVAGIAAGERVNAPLASISGAAPKAFLGNYKVFGTPGTNDEATLEAIVKAIEDAVNDGMNIINLSLGATTGDLPFNDPLDQAVDQATRAGVLVVVAAGNEGPGTGTITSPGTSPVAITVGASSNSRFLANPLTVSANVPVPAGLQTIGALFGTGPKITASVGAATLLDVISLDPAGTGCSPLPAGSLAGQFALIARGLCNFSIKIQNATNAGAIAVIVFNNQAGQPPALMDVGGATQIPSAMIGNGDGLALRQFLSSPGTIVQAILGAQAVAIPTPPNRMAVFSAGGPSTDFGLKPDLVAPGTAIYSAAQRNSASGVQFDPSGFTSFSGTSFSSPFVAGAAALLKQTKPSWTPAQIKSALVNTASKVVTSPNGTPVTVLSSGNGLLNASAALASALTVSPVSVSFGTLQQGVTPGAVNLTVTNMGAALDNFTVTVTPGLGASAKVTPSLTSFSLGAGVGMLLSISATPPAQPGTYEGTISIQGQSSGARVTASYWGSSLVPSVSPGGVVSAAGFASAPATLAAGQLISIFGNNLANNTESAITLPVPNSLGGTGVTIGGKPAPLLFASAAQINAQIPWELDGTTSAEVVVSLNGTSSIPIAISLAPASPAIFTVSQPSGDIGAVLHASDGSLVTAANPARANEFLEIFATGLGGTVPSVTTGSQASSDPISNTRIAPSVTIGGISAPVGFSGLAPGFVGLNQINVQVPSGLQPGPQIMTLIANGVASNSVTVSIGP